jgi:SAM-dependent methyltransferase
VKPSLLDLLRCPVDGGQLALDDARRDGDEVEEGTLACATCGERYPVLRGVPRFVPAENYAASFGMQWNHFRRTQLDSHTGVPVSRDRFYRYSGWGPAELRDAWVLEVGCGAGRFTEVALAAGAHVVAVDYSDAVDACRANHGAHPRLHVVQADALALPLEPGRFDFVFCFGVLQHTPDPAATFRALPRQLRPGGRIAVDVYARLWRNVLWSKYWLRPLTSRLPARTLFRAVERSVPWLLPVSRAVARIPVVGPRLRYAVPVANYEGVYPLSPSQLREWAVLDTFDMLSPAHDHPQTLATLRAWLDDAGLVDVWTGRMGFNVGRGRRPAEPAAPPVAPRAAAGGIHAARA